MTSVKFQPAVFKPFFPDFTPNNAKGADFRSPAINIMESVDGFTIELVAPGLKREDFEVKIEKNTLNVSTKPSEQPDQEPMRYHRREFNFKGFERNFRLPDTIDTDSVKATYTNGVMCITLAFKPELKPVVRTIEIA